MSAVIVELVGDGVWFEVRGRRGRVLGGKRDRRGDRAKDVFAVELAGGRVEYVFREDLRRVREGA